MPNVPVRRPRHRRRFALSLGAIALGAALPASAHVSVQLYGEKALAGKGAVVFVRIGHAEPGKSTTKVEVQLPDGVTSVKPQRIAGWTESTTTAADGKTVATVAWSGGSLPDSSFQDFGIKLTFPKTVGASLPFKTVQTLSDGSQLAWIELATPGAAEPAHPAPTITLVDPAAAAPSTVGAPAIWSGELSATLTAAGRRLRVIGDTSTTNAGKRYSVLLHGSTTATASGVLDPRGDVNRTITTPKGLSAGAALDLVVDGKVLASASVG